MDPFDVEILNLLRDGKPREFQQILSDVKFSHNTLRLHLGSLADQNLISKGKRPTKGRGRPRITYSTPLSVGRSLHMIPNPSTGVVSLSFNKLSQVCRFEKGGFCKKERDQCNAQDCPQIR
jgi:predicted ArsR family transcriptional regulator